MSWWILIYGSPCYGMNKHVLTEVEQVQKRGVNWVMFGKESYKDNFRALFIMPLTIFIQIKRILSGLLSKLLFGLSDISHLSSSRYYTFERIVLFQPESQRRTLRKTITSFKYAALQIFSELTCLTNQTQRWSFYECFVGTFYNYNKVTMCSRKLTSDCTLPTWRDKTKLWTPTRRDTELFGCALLLPVLQRGAELVTEVFRSL